MQRDGELNDQVEVSSIRSEKKRTARRSGTHRKYLTRIEIGEVAERGGRGEAAKGRRG